MATSSIRRFITSFVIPVALVLCILLSLPLVCGHDHHVHSDELAQARSQGHGHAHHHGHSHNHEPEEPASFKWSKQANDPYLEELDEPALPKAAEGRPAHEPSVSDEVAKAYSHGHGHSHYNGPSHKQAEPSFTEKPPRSSVWLEAILATLGISIAPYLILFVIPVTNSVEHAPYLKVLLAFASGGLLGDAFLHLIPHALMAQAATKGVGSHSHSHTHSHSHEAGVEGGHDMSIGLAVLAGIIAFLVVEKFVRLFKGGHSHSHSHRVPVTENEIKTKEETNNEEDKDPKEDDKEDENCEEVTAEDKGDIKVAGYLNLAADFTHNLTDGLAIGASFLAGKNVGIVTTVTIFLHEIPHEIGDFAILLQSGCTRKKAMMLQLVTALGALTGTVISLLAEGADDSSIAWILPFTAGGFIYIATVSVIPELLENSRVWQSVFEIMALLSGVALMMAIAHLEELGHDH